MEKMMGWKGLTTSMLVVLAACGSAMVYAQTPPPLAPLSHGINDQIQCNGGTFYGIAYVGATDFYAQDYFSSSSPLHREFDFGAGGESRISIANPYGFNMPAAFDRASIAKPKNVSSSVISREGVTPLTAPANPPANRVNRSNMAARILYHLKRRSYQDGAFNHPVYYTPVGGSLTNVNISTNPNSNGSGQDTECQQIYLGFCGDTVVDNSLTGGTYATGTYAGLMQRKLDGGEECDLAMFNGVPCVPATGESCTYCSDTCEWITLTGSICNSLTVNPSVAYDNQGNVTLTCDGEYASSYTFIVTAGNFPPFYTVTTGNSTITLPFNFGEGTWHFECQVNNNVGAPADSCEEDLYVGRCGDGILQDTDMDGDGIPEEECDPEVPGSGGPYGCNEDTCEFIDSFDLLVTKEVLSGYLTSTSGLVTFIINYQNIGTLVATGVKVKDLLPQWLLYSTATPPPANIQNIPGGGQRLTWNVGTLQPGQTGQIILTTISNREGGGPGDCPEPVNYVQITPLTGDANPTNNDDEADVSCQESYCAELYFTPQIGNVPLDVDFYCQGLGTDYIITATNAQGQVVWTDTMVWTGTGPATFATSNVFNQTGVYAISCTVDGQSDAYCNSNLYVNIPQVKDLSVWKTTLSGYLNSTNGQVTFDIFYRNDGNQTITNVHITDYLPLELIYVSSTSVPNLGQPAIMQPNPPQQLRWTIPSLAPGQSGHITLVTQSNRSGGGAGECPDPINYVTITTPPGDPTPGNNESEDDVDCTPSQCMNLVAIPPSVTSGTTPLTVNVSCQGIGGNYEITLYNAQGQVVGVVTNTGGLATFVVTDPGQYNAVCEIDGQSSPSCELPITATEPQVPDLFISKEYNNGYINTQSGQVTFTIWYGNQGNTTINNVHITDILPPQLVYASSLVNGQPATPTVIGGTIIDWNVGTLVPGQVGEITVTATTTNVYTGAGCSFGDITNTGMITIVPGEVDTGDNIDDASPPCEESYCTELIVSPYTTFHPGETATFSCEGFGENYVIQIVNSATQIIVTTINANSGTYTFNVLGNYTVQCVVDGQANPTGSECIQSVTVSQEELPDTYVNKYWLTGVVSTTNNFVTFKLKYGNQGNVAVNNMIVTDTLPNELGYVSYTSNPNIPVGNFTQNGSVLTWNVGTLQPGQSGEIIITTTVQNYNGEGCSEVNNEAEITLAPNDTNPGNNNDEVAVPCVPSVCTDLVSSATVTQPGQTVTFTCTGVGELYQITLTDDSNGVQIAQTSAQTLTYTFPNVGNYTAVCTVDGQTNPSACEESVTVSNEQFPDVYVIKDLLSGSIVQNGDIVTFKIRYGNIGNAVASGVVITDTLPYPLKYFRHSTSPFIPAANFTIQGDVLTWTLPFPLQPGQTGEIILKTKVTDFNGVSCDTYAINNVVITTTSNDIDPTNNEDDAAVDCVTAWCDAFAIMPTVVTTGQAVSFMCWGGGGEFVTIITNAAGQQVGVITGMNGYFTFNQAGTYYATCYVGGFTANECNGSIIVTGSNVSIPDLKIVKERLSGQLNVSGYVVFKLTYSNIGNTGVNNVVVTDTLPAGLTYDSFLSSPSLPAGSFSQNGNQLSWNIGTLQPGQQGTITVFAKSFPLSGACVPQQNISTITLPTGDPTPTNNTSTASVPCGDTPEQSQCTTLQVVPQQGSAPLTSQFTCDGIGSTYLIQILDLSTNTVIGTIPAQSGSFTFTQPGSYAGICYVDGVTADSCRKPVTVGGACESLTFIPPATPTPDVPFTGKLSCEGTGSYFEISLFNASGVLIQSWNNNGNGQDLVVEYYFTQEGQYTALCTVDGSSSLLCTDDPVNPNPHVPLDPVKPDDQTVTPGGGNGHDGVIPVDPDKVDPNKTDKTDGSETTDGFTFKLQSFASTPITTWGYQKVQAPYSTISTQNIGNASLVDAYGLGAQIDKSVASAFLNQHLNQFAQDVAAGTQTVTPFVGGTHTTPTQNTDDFFRKLKQQQDSIKDNANKSCYDPCRITFTLGKTPPAPFCGDGVLGTGEACDDGNNTNGDGCSATCTTEGGGGSTGTPHSFCGDGVVNPGEQCDDGNTINNDGCSNACTPPNYGGGNNFCGDGVVRNGEECDDGNAINGDGCSTNCTRPGGGGGSYCGNGRVEAGEVCDDGAANGANSICTASCRLRGFDISEAKCAEIDPPSIQAGEPLPFRWNLEADATTTSCGVGAIGKIKEDTLLCRFTIVNAAGTQVDQFTKPCTTQELKQKAWYNDFARTLSETNPDARNMLSRSQGNSAWDSSIIENGRTVYGEYAIALDQVSYQICTSNGSGSSFSSNRIYNTDRVCQYNFAITSPYLIQKGVSFSTFADDTKKLSSFRQMRNQETLLAGLRFKEVTLSKSETTNVLQSLITTYRSRATEIVTDLSRLSMDGTRLKKVNTSEIYMTTDTLTIDTQGKTFNGGKATTLLVDGAVHINIVGSLDGNLMIVAPLGTITFVNTDCDAQADVVKGIYLAKSFSTYSRDLGQNKAILNKENQSVWCNGGGLTIEGMLVGSSTSDMQALRDSRRSTLSDWFNKGAGSRDKQIFDGAALLIRVGSSFWNTLPPAAKELLEDMNIYKK